MDRHASGKIIDDLKTLGNRTVNHYKEWTTAWTIDQVLSETQEKLLEGVLTSRR